MLRLRSRGSWSILLTLGVLACTPPKETPDGGSDAGSDDSGPVDSGSRDAGVDAGRDAGLIDGGPDSGCDADATCGITTPPNVGDPGWPCSNDSQCNQLPGGFCQTQYRRCSRPCGSIADCPVSWTCEPVGSSGVPVCQCPVKPPVADTCNNVDDNCDGLVDNTADICGASQTCNHGTCECPAANLCNGACVDRQTDPLNCGVCGHACNEGYACQAGGCVCPTTGPNVICSTGADGGNNFVCVNNSTDPRHCGACGNTCDADEDCLSGQCVTSDHEWARWSLTTPPAYSSGSVPGPGSTMIPVVIESVSGLTWQRDVAQNSYTWANAATYCAGLGAGWRVPTRIELLSLIDYTRFSPAFDRTVFPQPTSEWRASVFWSATTQATNTANAWNVDFSSGYSNAATKTNAYPVRCVQ